MGKTEVRNKEPDVFRRLSTKTVRKSSILPSASQHRWTLADFEIGKRLGRGKFGKVYCSREKKSNYVCAVKVMGVKNSLQEANGDTQLESQLEGQLVREIEIHARLRHRNCLALHTWFFDKKYIYLIVEYAPRGELYAHLSKAKGGRFNNFRAASVIAQIARALIYLHSRGIIHRDVKPENILVHSNGRVVLADFGWATYTNTDSARGDSNRRSTLCGTLDYLPPEMVEAKSHDKRVDWWALGILLYEMLVGKPPFESPQMSDTYRLISRCDYSIPSYVNTGAADLIAKLLQRNPMERMELQKVVVHRWVVEFAGLTVAENEMAFDKDEVEVNRS